MLQGHCEQRDLRLEGFELPPQILVQRVGRGVSSEEKRECGHAPSLVAAAHRTGRPWATG
jgi:hypothetical protein